MNKTEEFIRKARLKHGDKYDYSKVEYVKNSIKVIIICQKHNEFLQTPNNHLYGFGCNSCGTANKQRSNIDEFLEKSKSIHGDTYDYSKVEYINNNTKIKIICKEHDEFLQTPAGHLRGGCKLCANKLNGEIKRNNTEDFIQKAKEIHGDTYDYSKVEYIKNNITVKIICKTHGEFTQLPSCHYIGHGCLTCSNNKTADRCRSTIEEFILKAKLKHGDTYDYSKVEYITSIITVKIICKTHGEFLQIPSNHLQGQGCAKCGKVYKYTPEEWIVKAKNTFGNKFDYTETKYITAKLPITILCKTGNYKFETTPYSHLIQKHGCKKCYGNYEYSNDEWKDKAKHMFGDLYDYSKVNYTKSSVKITITCKRCNRDFEQVPNSHLQGHGCNRCYGSYQYSNDEWKEKAIQLYGKKYNYDNTQYVNSDTKVNIICLEHGEFSQNPLNHLYGYEGCSKCWKKNNIQNNK